MACQFLFAQTLDPRLPFTVGVVLVWVELACLKHETRTEDFNPKFFCFYPSITISPDIILYQYN